MDLREAIRTRRSVRAYLPKPVPQETIRELINDAIWSPSWANTQPWEILVVAGDTLDKFKTENRQALLKGETSFPDITVPKDWPDALKSRRIDLGKSVFDALSIERDNIDGRMEYYAQMYYLFDAPALILFLIDKELALEYTMLDTGIFLQTFSLLAHDRGLGTCPFGATVHCPEIVHKLFSIPDNKLLVIGLALGWPDKDAPVNNFERRRGRIEEFVKWIS